LNGFGTSLEVVPLWRGCRRRYQTASLFHSRYYYDDPA